MPKPYDNLLANLENPLPRSLPVGVATAVFLVGTCFHRDAGLSGLEIEVSGRGRYEAAAFAMPRPDIFNMLHPDGVKSARIGGRGGGGPHDPRSTEDPNVRGFQSGFWATVPVVAPSAPGPIELSAVATLDDGREVSAPLGSFPAVDRERPPARGGSRGEGLIAVCMATYEPDLELFRVQVDSLRSQTDPNWVCVISDDCSAPDRYAEMEAVIAGDDRFVMSRADKRAKFYRNFERALTLAPAEADLFALCDQDDRWFPEKLAILRDALADAMLVYSDQRLVDADGRILRETMWKGRSNNHTDITSMLVANTVTGAATLFRRELAELALPFPETPGMQFHDHWLALVAMAAGEVAYVDRPLYDYVQHGRAIFGDVSTAPRTAVARLTERRPTLEGLTDRLRGGRGAYFLGYLPRDAQARVLLTRLEGRIAPGRLRALRRFLRAADSPLALARLAFRPLRALRGRNETLGSELELVRGIVWKWIVEKGSRRSRIPGRGPTDARYPNPLAFEQKRVRRWRSRA